MNDIYPNITVAMRAALNTLKEYGSLSTTESWQGIKQPVPMWEYEGISFKAMMPLSKFGAQRDIKPDLPWAEDHFLERVAGEPLNPGNEYKNWPHYKNKAWNDKNFRSVEWSDEKKRIEQVDQQFTHTYMERYWPKHAGPKVVTSADLHEVSIVPGGYAAGYKNVEYEKQSHKGIRYPYGDLNDVINLLVKEPHTRQAYLPVWFPEDTGVLHGGRVPCTLGYHFSMRHDRLNITYMIRACDAIRHFRNDVYLTVRLAQWVLLQCGKKNRQWLDVQPGTLTMHIMNFHVFNQEKNLI